MQNQQIEENMEDVEEAMMAPDEEGDQQQDGDDELVEIEVQELENTPENQLRVLEAMLFASSKPLSPQIMLERLPEGADLNILLPQLQEQYQGRGIELTEVGGQWAFRTVQDVGASLTVEKEVSRKMSKAALETLSIVAYHQPLTRAEIENIRGVATNKGTLDILMEMGWVKPGRRRETPGRPLTWMTTHNFLDHFQLESLNDLPGLQELKDSGLMDKRAAIDTLPDTGDLFDNPDEDAQEVMDAENSDISDEDAFDEASYKEIKAREKQQEQHEEVQQEQNEEQE